MNVHKYSQSDFDEYSLPHNRKEVFFDVLKMRYGTLIFVGLLLLAFTLPLLLVKILGETVFVGLYETLGEQESAYDYARVLRFYISLSYIPCLAVFAVGVAGATRVVRQLVWGEGVFFWGDFSDGIKQNYKNCLLTFLLLGLTYALCSFILVLNVEYQFVVYIPIALFYIVALPTAMLMISQTAIYSVGFFDLIKNSLKLWLKYVPQGLIFSALVIVGVLLDGITLTVLKYILMILLIIFALPLYLEARFLFDCHVFDEHINKKDYPEIVDKGLFRIK